ncbi:MAG: hypothetical protein R8L58_04660 [Mariprofundaceae bacterium]
MFGLFIASHIHDARHAVGLCTANSAVGVFHRKAADVNVRVDYRYRKMGGDLKPFGLWPENRYQTVGAGVALHW